MTRARTSRRAAEVTASATLGLQARARALAAQGRPVTLFGAGEPDLLPPAAVLDTARAALDVPAHHRYSPVSGLEPLRAAIARKTLRDSGLSVAPDEVLVTNGAKQAVFNGLAAIVDPGDEVVVPAPFWPTYPEAVRLLGATPVVVPTDEGAGFKVRVEQLERARGPRTRAVVLVSPGNPTGAVYTAAELTAIGAWAVEHSVWVVVDEIYEHFVYDGLRAPSLPVVVPAARDHCLVVNGVAKSHALPGWRLGWLLGPPDVVAAAAGVQSHTTSHVNNLAQAAAIVALDDTASVRAARDIFAARRLRMLQALSTLPGFTCHPPDGAFFVFPSVQGVLGTVVAGREVTTATDLAEVLLAEASVAVLPGEAFGSPGHLRLSYALDESEIAAGLERVRRLLA